MEVTSVSVTSPVSVSIRKKKKMTVSYRRFAFKSTTDLYLSNRSSIGYGIRAVHLDEVETVLIVVINLIY